MPVTFFPVTSPVSKTFAFLRAHYAICRYMFTVGFQCIFRKITARFSAGRRKQLVVSDILPFWCSWFKYRFITIDLATVGKFCFNFSRVLGGIVDCVNVNPSARALKPWLACAQNVCALTKVGTVLKDVRANCFCASLLRTRITCHVMPRHASSARAKY